MNYLVKLFILTCVTNIQAYAEDTDILLGDLFREISSALNAEASPHDGQTRQQQYPYRPQNNAISLGLYEALQSIARNDELECVSRLLCEAAAGGQPGYSGKQIKFDKLSLTNLMSYLKLDSTSSSPLLIFGRAALLGVSNRGDPYSCIINYPKCPKDQSRLLYYLNNHRGGFFQYFDKKYHKPGNYYPVYNQYRPGYYKKKYNRNKIQFESSDGLYEKFKKKAETDIYAKKYTHSSISFPSQRYSSYKNPMVFPNEDRQSPNPRILTNPYDIRTQSEDKDFYFSRPNRFPKSVKQFFPSRDQPLRQLTNHVTDRLPIRFYFPEDKGESYTAGPSRPKLSKLQPTKVSGNFFGYCNTALSVFRPGNRFQI